MRAVESYGLDRPTPDDLVMSLSMVLPEQEVHSAINRARLDLELPPLETLGSAELGRLAHRLTFHRGLVAVIARSFMIRLASYTKLEETAPHA